MAASQRFVFRRGTMKLATRLAVLFACSLAGAASAKLPDAQQKIVDNFCKGSSGSDDASALQCAAGRMRARCFDYWVRAVEQRSKSLKGTRALGLAQFF